MNAQSDIDISGYKLVTLEFTDKAAVVVKADTDEEASEAVLSSFAEIPDLKIISIEDAPEDTVKEILERNSEAQKALN